MDREHYLDYAKGIVILAMLFSHTLSGNDPIRTYISSFHMQFFFIVCGILFQKKNGNNKVLFCNMKIAVFRRLKQLGVPYLVFSLLLSAFYATLALVSGKETGLINRMISIISLRGIDSLWFIPIYFFAELLMYFISLSSQRERISICLVVVSFLSVFLVSGRVPENPYIQMLIRILVGFSFVWLGSILEKTNIIDRLEVTPFIVLFVIGVVLSQINGFSAMGSLEINNCFLFFGNAAISSIAILALCKKLERVKGASMKFLDSFGKNSIVVLCSNNILIESFRLLDYKLTGNWLLKNGLIGSGLFWIILVAAECPLIHLSAGKLGVIFGKRV